MRRRSGASRFEDVNRSGNPGQPLGCGALRAAMAAGRRRVLPRTARFVRQLARRAQAVHVRARHVRQPLEAHIAGSRGRPAPTSLRTPRPLRPAAGGPPACSPSRTPDRRRVPAGPPPSWHAPAAGPTGRTVPARTRTPPLLRGQALPMYARRPLRPSRWWSNLTRVRRTGARSSRDPRAGAPSARPPRRRPEPAPSCANARSVLMCHDHPPGVEYPVTHHAHMALDSSDG